MLTLAFPQFHTTAATPSRRYIIEKRVIDLRASGFLATAYKWEAVAYAVGVAECDATMARKTRFEGGRYRATEAKHVTAV